MTEQASNEHKTPTATSHPCARCLQPSTFSLQPLSRPIVPHVVRSVPHCLSHASEGLLPLRPMQTVLTIAGSDPTGGAGLQADLQVIRHLGCHGAGVLSALTVQDTAKVHSVLPVFPSVVLDQLRTVLRDLRVDAVKIGMLATDDVVRNVILALAELDPSVPIVIDPVLQASDGKPLLERRAWPALTGLFARAALVTPNLPEAESLTGCSTASRAGCEDAAGVFLSELAADAVLIKGGHREGNPDDLLAWRDGEKEHLEWLEGTRISSAGGPVHGTGCALSTSIAAGLARGLELREAVAAGRRFVARGLANTHSPGRGAAFLGFDEGA